MGIVCLTDGRCFIFSQAGYRCSGTSGGSAKAVCQDDLLHVCVIYQLYINYNGLFSISDSRFAALNWSWRRFYRK